MLLNDETCDINILHHENVSPFHLVVGLFDSLFSKFQIEPLSKFMIKEPRGNIRMRDGQGRLLSLN
jgi:hypothetical protein